MTFSVMILILLWILQVIFIKNYYQSMRKREITNIGNKLTKLYGSDEFEDALSEYVFKDNIKVYSIKEVEGGIILTDILRVYGDKRYTGNSFIAFNDFKHRLVKSGLKPIQYIIQENKRTSVVYGSLLKNSTTGELNYLYLTSPLPPIDSTVDILKNQMIIITIILLILSLLIAQRISKRLAVPIVQLTRSAEELAKGNIEVDFYRGGYTEIYQLASTLSYATRELSKLDQYRKDFIANVSHDLKTPLTIIKFYSEMIKDVSGDNKEKRDNHCNVIMNETDRLTGLVNEILELSKLQSNNITLTKTKFSMGQCVLEVLEGFDILCEREAYRFEKNIEAHLMVEADKQYMKRVIYNLISNAINYTGDDKKVVIILRQKGEKVRFEVSDTGSGIAKEELQTIWERYYKSKEPHKRAVVGTGLGLSIVKNVLQVHGAAYGVQSEMNKGSTFWFELHKCYES